PEQTARTRCTSPNKTNLSRRKTMLSRISGDPHLRRAFWVGFLVLGFWMNIATATFAQGEASIQGVVSDSSGGAIPGVAIRVKNVETGAERHQVTDEAGRYEAGALPVGRYEVRAEKAGFRSEEKTGVSL